jgi:hypothetical protein
MAAYQRGSHLQSCREFWCWEDNCRLTKICVLAQNARRLIQVDIGGHPPFPAGSKQLSSNFDNLLFLAVFSGPELPEPF